MGINPRCFFVPSSSSKLYDPFMMSQLVSAAYPPVLELRPCIAISGLAPDAYTILAVAKARIYHAQLTTKSPEWCYMRMRGTLVFGKDSYPGEQPVRRPSTVNEANSYWFRLLDSLSGKPIWMFKIAAGFVYELDRPFFHVFQGKSRRFGFLFEDDDEASILAKKVIAQTCPPRPQKSRSLSFTLRGKSQSDKDSSRPSIQTSVISLPTPNSFMHVAHIGLNDEGVVEATSGIDPSWRAILEGYGQHDLRHHDKVPVKKISITDNFWQVFERESRHSGNASTTELAGHRSILPQNKFRHRLHSPSFTLF